MNRNKNSGPKGLLRSLSLPTLRSFSPSLHTSTHKQFPKFIFGDRDVFRSYVDFIQTSWEFCDDRSNENGFARAFGGDGGTCECRGGMPPRTPPLFVTRFGGRSIPEMTFGGRSISKNDNLAGLNSLNFYSRHV